MTDTASLPAKKRALPFKRTAARRPAPDPFDDEPRHAAIDKPDGDEDGLNLFRRSEKVFPRAVEERERRKRTKEERKRRSCTAEEKDGRSRRSLPAEDEGAPNRERKRARKSIDAEDVNRAPRRPGNIEDCEVEWLDKKSRDQEKGQAQTTGSHITPPSTSSSRNKASPRSLRSEKDRTKSESPPVIIDDDDDPFAEITPPLPRNGHEDSDSDVEIVENPSNEPDEDEHYIIKAREREAARLGAAAAAAAAAAADRKALEKRGFSEQSQDVDFSGPKSSAVGGTRSARDPVVRILIISAIPDAVPLAVDRKLSQNMRIVIDTWIAQQLSRGVQMSKDVAESVFLTWKGNKIYNTTTLESLGLDVDGDGRVASPRAGSSHLYTSSLDDNDGYEDGKLVFEMWTEDLYQDYLKRKEHERLKSLGEIDDDDAEDGVSAQRGDEDAAGESRGEKIRVILKSKDMEPARIATYAHTPIDIVEKAFRNMCNIEEHRQITLRFDGDVLDPASTVGETDIEDMDTIEVYIK